MLKENQKHFTPLLGLAAVICFIGLLMSRALYPELLAPTLISTALLLAALAGLFWENQKALRSRSATYGLNSAITILLVISIVGVLNFLSSRYPYKLDLTKNQVHTLSSQTTQLVRGLKQPVKATLFSKLQQKEQFWPLLKNYQSLNPKFELEFVNLDTEPSRVRQAGIKRYDTLQLTFGSKESKIEEPNEEKITNALIKLFKDKVPTLCAVTGHGEKSFASSEAEGYQSIKNYLTDQSYQVKDLNLLESNQVPESCDAVAIIGPTKAFFEAEARILRDYFAQGGRGVMALDVNIRGQEYAPELLPLLSDWSVQPLHALIVDPSSRLLGVDASVALVKAFSKASPITRDIQGGSAFPLARPLKILANAPASVKVEWLAQTSTASWGVTDLKLIQKGEARFDPARDEKGPLNTALAIEGKLKDSKASKNTRLVVFGTSSLATNNYSRFAGNLDFFLNSVSWVLEDESLISIRSKEDGPGKVELSEKAGHFIALLTILILPFVISIGGVTLWAIRRKL
ncbi:MAG: GldG family protein [Bdellovibrionia bacterium]